MDNNEKVAYYIKGKSLENLGKYSEAIECFNKAIQIDSKYIDAYNSKGISLNILGKYMEALECFNIAI